MGCRREWEDPLYIALHVDIAELFAKAFFWRAMEDFQFHFGAEGLYPS
jgi:hypothetical protein